ncbi:MAG: 8-amino-7-oxononanoate synthase [Eudoraea sp.]|nr:8-amino-7-oxononanoate synthase [Eudoraea sp.]NNK31157.1 8-amino-7-oxononanoate synthase [Flavobacteriaceae bacterium]
MESFPRRLHQKLSKREASNALRYLSFNEGKLDFCSNDYLGFAGSPELSARINQRIKENPVSGSGASGSRLLSGNSKLHEDLEEFLSKYYGAEAALLFNSGYDANLGVFASMLQKGDLVIYDELVHASIRDGIQMSYAKAHKFRHNDLEDLERKLQRGNPEAADQKECTLYVVTESVFSMDGDSPELQGLVALCRQYSAYLIVDEAHATGIYGDKGTGLVREHHLQDDVFARIITFGKAFGTHGAAVLGSSDLKKYLINYARSFIYSTALPPHSLVAIRESHRLLDAAYGKTARQLLRENITYFRSQIDHLQMNADFVFSTSPIQSFILPENKRVKQVADKIREQGFDVRPILSPTVPIGKERIRFCLHSFNEKKDIAKVLNLLRKIV